MIKTVSIKTKSNTEHVMSVDTYSRWLCLVEALQHVNTQAKKSKVDLDKTDKWIKPLTFQKYIKERFHSMNHDFKVEEHLD